MPNGSSAWPRKLRSSPSMPNNADLLTEQSSGVSHHSLASTTSNSSLAAVQGAGIEQYFQTQLAFPANDVHDQSSTFVPATSKEPGLLAEGPDTVYCDEVAETYEPPNLFASLQKDQFSPPLEDMRPVDPEYTPYAQELRFEGDLYTPKYVRGHGNKREGWCGICNQGRWLVLKNSAFWYDKSFTHGISAATGAAFEGPKQTRQTKGKNEAWEGLCGSCGEWIALFNSKKKGTTWFRHAYKVGSHSPRCMSNIDGSESAIHMQGSKT